MKNSYRLIVFDWDGTLMDSEARIVDCIQRAAGDAEVAVPSDHAARDIIGLGLDEAMARLFPDCDENAVRHIVDAYRSANTSLIEEVFTADLLLSTQLLATTRILNSLLGHNTLEVEYLAQGKVELRRIHIERRSALTKKPLSEMRMPAGSLVVAFFRGDAAASGD